MMSFLQPQFLWLLAALPLVVILHFVRARRRTQAVSALFLWAQAKELAVKRRRVSPTWLLLVQLLFVTALALALAQPQLGRAGTAPRIFVLDASASMAAEEPQGTRLEQAIEAAGARLEGAGEVAVVRAGLGATVVQALTSDHAEVHAALQELVAVDARVALGDALELARSLAPSAEVHLFSDQAPPAGFVDLYVHPVGEGVPNVGISALELAYGQLFASVVSNTPYPQNLELVLERGNESTRTPLLVPANGQANVSVPVDDASGIFRAYLEGLGDDALSLDNEAFIGSRELRVLLSPPTPSLERALNTLPGISVQSTNSISPVQDAPLLGADVTIFLGAPPEPLPGGNLVLFSAPQEEPVYGRVADWLRSDPLLRFVDLSGVVVPLLDTGAFEIATPDTATPDTATPTPPLPLPEADAEVLAQTGALTPALLRWREAGREVVLFAFHPSQSDIVRRPAFPILLANLMAGFRVDTPAPLGTLLGEGVRVSEPGLAEFGGRTYTVSLLSAAESRLEVTAQAVQPDTSTTTGAEGTATTPAQPGASPATFDLWVWLALGGTVLLLAEWLLWSRERGWGQRA